MGKVVLYGSVSVDGFVADENDQPGPLFDWFSGGDVPLDEGGHVKVSQASHDYTRAYWDEIGVTVVGRHVFDLTDGWGGTPPSGIDHVVVVSHRPAPEGWAPDAPFHFVDGIEAAMAKAQELAGERTVEVAAGDVGGQVLAAGLVDEVRMDVTPAVLGSGKRFFGPVDAQHLLEDPDAVVRGTGCSTCATACADSAPLVCRGVAPDRDLFANFERMRREMDELFGDVFDRGMAPVRRGGFSPAVDVYYSSDPPRAIVRADLAGIDPAGIALEIRGRELILSGHRARRSPARTASTSSSRSSTGRSGASCRSAPTSTRTPPARPTRTGC